MVQNATDKFRWWPWIIVGVFLVFFIPTHILVQAQYQQRVDAYIIQSHLNFNAVVKARHEHLAFHAANYNDQPSMQFATIRLNGGQPFVAVPETAGQFLWTDPAGGRAIIEAQGDSWVSVAYAPLVYPRPVGWAAALLLTRQLAYLGLYLLWPILGIIWLGTWPRTTTQRTRWAVHLLLLSATATLLALIGPQYWRAWRSFFQDDFAAWGLIQVMLSVLALWASRFIQLRNDGLPRCRNCRYQLTGNVSGICPECGTPIPGARTAGRGEKQEFH